MLSEIALNNSYLFDMLRDALLFGCEFDNVGRLRRKTILLCRWIPSAIVHPAWFESLRGTVPHYSLFISRIDWNYYRLSQGELVNTMRREVDIVQAVSMSPTLILSSAAVTEKPKILRASTFSILFFLVFLPLPFNKIIRAQTSYPTDVLTGYKKRVLKQD